MCLPTAHRTPVRTLGWLASANWVHSAAWEVMNGEREQLFLHS